MARISVAVGAFYPAVDWDDPRMVATVVEALQDRAEEAKRADGR